jgi:hypothetical protein
MESFFLSETTKYLYLLFDTDNFIHNAGNQATVVDTDRGQCILDAGKANFFFASTKSSTDFKQSRLQTKSTDFKQNRRPTTAHFRANIAPLPIIFLRKMSTERSLPPK